MDDKKAEDIRIINLKKIDNSVTDYFVLATGNSNIHVMQYLMEFKKMY